MYNTVHTDNKQQLYPKNNILDRVLFVNCYLVHCMTLFCFLFFDVVIMVIQRKTKVAVCHVEAQLKMKLH